MAFRLVYGDARGARRTLPITSEVTTVGRSAEGTAVRLGARNVSRHHARFFVVDGVPFIEDAGSLNGTFVNDERLRGRRRLRDGDKVRIGAHTLVVETWTGEETAEIAAAERRAEPPPLPLSAPMDQEECESTVAIPAPPLRAGRLRDALAKALRALSGQDES